MEVSGECARRSRDIVRAGSPAEGRPDFVESGVWGLFMVLCLVLRWVGGEFSHADEIMLQYSTVILASASSGFCPRFWEMPRLILRSTPAFLIVPLLLEQQQHSMVTHLHVQL